MCVPFTGQGDCPVRRPLAVVRRDLMRRGLMVPDRDAREGVRDAEVELVRIRALARQGNVLLHTGDREHPATLIRELPVDEPGAGDGRAVRGNWGRRCTPPASRNGDLARRDSERAPLDVGGLRAGGARRDAELDGSLSEHRRPCNHPPLAGPTEQDRAVVAAVRVGDGIVCHRFGDGLLGGRGGDAPRRVASSDREGDGQGNRREVVHGVLLLVRGKTDARHRQGSHAGGDESRISGLRRRRGPLERAAGGQEAHTRKPVQRGSAGGVVGLGGGCSTGR